MRVDITALYCCLDDFAKLFEDWERHKLIDTGRKRNRQGKLSLSEMLLIMVLFHTSSFKNFKCFYFCVVGQQYREYFTEIPSYEGLAKRGKTTMGWFFGFKLHITINHKGEIVAVRITPGNVDDPLPAGGSRTAERVPFWTK